MSENSTTTTQSPDGLIGLATNLGALRSDLNHHIEDQNRTLAELHTTFSDERAALEERIIALESTVSGLAKVLHEAVEAMVKYTETKREPSTSAKASSITTPVRERGETNRAFFDRLTRWADAHGVERPPKAKTGPVASTSNYDQAVLEWSRSLSA